MLWMPAHIPCVPTRSVHSNSFPKLTSALFCPRAFSGLSSPFCLWQAGRSTELTPPKKQLSIRDCWEMAVPLLSGIILMHVLLWAANILHWDWVYSGDWLDKTPFGCFSFSSHFPITLPIFSGLNPGRSYLYLNSLSGSASGKNLY